KEINSYLKNEITLEEAKELIIKSSLALSKKQKTFFKNKFDINVFEYDNPCLIDDCLTLIKNSLK
ncbi:MAG: tRNA (adenosine(37)-N6)-dimethylallyltransferase MiaA, partial [Acholeplasmatales bacterium]|nr:tRNA (adenosine(37)-N6)-dimethylallyltransferase MiaA [Acholeplasmatales bacterium]